MRDLAPDIVRQRLLIEGLYRADVDQAWVEGFLTGLAAHLELRSYGRPIVHSPGGAGKDENQGYDAFLPLIDSGISLYVWSRRRFFALVLFTCKRFDAAAAVAYSEAAFQAEAVAQREF